MNRTRKIAAAGLATAVAVVLIAMVLVAPALHTQTPVSVTPPASGGTGSGSSGATSASTNTTNGCTASSGNRTGENGDHDEGAASTCGDPPVDHDVQGDLMSSEHRNIAAVEHMFSGISADVLAFAQLGATWVASLRTL